MNEAAQKAHAVAPFPWRYLVHPNGKVEMLDARGTEVPMFIMLDFVSEQTINQLKEATA